MIVRLTLPAPPRALSPNARPSMWDKVRAVSDYRQCARLLGRSEYAQHPKGTFPLKEPVTARLTHVVTTGRGRDQDNYQGTMIKPIFDGLRDAHILAADTADALVIEPVQFERGKHAEVRVELSSGG